MGKIKRLKKLMEAEAELIHQKLNEVIGELDAVKRQAAKDAHPSNRAAFIELVSKFNADDVSHVSAAIDRANEPKPHAKRVTFKRVRSDLYGSGLVLDPETLSELALLGVTYSFTPGHRGNSYSGFNVQFTPFITRANVGELTNRVNELMPDGQRVYAEVEILG